MGVFNIDKKALRKEYLAIRNNLSEREVLSRSQSIAVRLNQLEYVAKAKSIMCYVSFRNEVHTHEMIRKWLLEGKQVCVPCVVKAPKEDRCMHAVRINSFSELTEAGNYGILEPPLRQGNIVAPERFDAIIVPGSVFDINKNRIGYGAGFYDCFLGKTSRECHKIGICYDFQLLDSITYDEYDVPLDLLVTEKRIII